MTVGTVVDLKDVGWEWGTELAEELLGSIALLGKSAGGTRSMTKIENKGFTVYWAGTVLRIDIKESDLI